MPGAEAARRGAARWLLLAGGAALAAACNCDPCVVGTASSAATAGSLGLFGQVTYFADGGALPTGRYRLAYEDGCMKYSSAYDWTVNEFPAADVAEPKWWLVGERSDQRVVAAPGTTGYFTSNGAYASFATCVAANHALATPKDFDWDGGRLGVWLNDDNYQDNVPGEAGRNPAWTLTRLSCP